eukprot:1180072-Prorocentrum_minimum.AAC.3
MDGCAHELQMFLNLGEESTESTLVYEGDDVRLTDALAFRVFYVVALVHKGALGALLAEVEEHLQLLGTIVHSKRRQQGQNAASKPQNSRLPGSDPRY